MGQRVILIVPYPTLRYRENLFGRGQEGGDGPVPQHNQEAEAEPERQICPICHEMKNVNRCIPPQGVLAVATASLTPTIKNQLSNAGVGPELGIKSCQACANKARLAASNLASQHPKVTQLQPRMVDGRAVRSTAIPLDSPLKTSSGHAPVNHS